MAEETPAPRGKEKPFTFFADGPAGYPTNYYHLRLIANPDVCAPECNAFGGCSWAVAAADTVSLGDAEPCGCDADITCLTHSDLVHLQRRCRCGTTDGSDGCRG